MTQIATAQQKETTNDGNGGPHHNSWEKKMETKRDGGKMAVWLRQMIVEVEFIQLSWFFVINKALETRHSKWDNQGFWPPPSPKQHISDMAASYSSFHPSKRKQTTPSFPILAATTHLQRTLDFLRELSNRFISHLDHWNTQFLEIHEKKGHQGRFLFWFSSWLEIRKNHWQNIP